MLRVLPHLPAALLLLFSAASGTLLTGVRAPWVLAGHLALLLFVAACGRPWPDPLGLGRRGNLLLAAFALLAVASHLASPVARAGRLGLVLLPAFLLVPSAVARCWSTAGRRRAGLASLSLVVLFVAGGSLVEWWRLGTPGASLPLGHHNLLAAWLLALLPLAAVPWRHGAGRRRLAAAAVVVGLAALLATGSLGAAVAVAAVAAAGVLRRWAWPVALAAVALLASQASRIAAVAAGADTSVAARWAYLEAGWRGLAERPMLGWGPGAARWTIAEHLRPVPGVHPPDEVVGDLHCLPLEVAYELGWSGLLLAAGLGLVFVLRRRRAEVVDPPLRRAALLCLAALAVVSCFGLPLAVGALPLAAAIGVGAVLASEAPATRRGGRAGPVLAAAAMAALLLPYDLAHLAYDRAVDAAGRPDRLRHLRRATELDPAFPLYRARLAWLEGELRPGDPEIARRARAAAADARGVAPLWLVAGALGQEAGEPWRRDALIEACRLSPLGSIAPFRLSLERDAPEDLRVEWAGRALLAEPLLLAAAWSDGEIRDTATRRLGGVEGVDSGWVRELSEAALDAAPDPGTPGPIRRLALEMDGEAPTSASLYAFRRRPWPVILAEVEVYEEGVRGIYLGGAVGLRGTDGAIFQHRSCGLGRVEEQPERPDPGRPGE